MEYTTSGVDGSVGGGMGVSDIPVSATILPQLSLDLHSDPEKFQNLSSTFTQHDIPHSRFE